MKARDVAIGQNVKITDGSYQKVVTIYVNDELLGNKISIGTEAESLLLDRDAEVDVQ